MFAVECWQANMPSENITRRTASFFWGGDNGHGSSVTGFSAPDTDRRRRRGVVKVGIPTARGSNSEREREREREREGERERVSE